MSEIDPSGLCGNCVGACCRGSAKLTMALSEIEAENLRAVGTVLIEFLPADEQAEWGDRKYFKNHTDEARKFVKKASRGLDQGQGLYGLASDCGFLEETPDGRAICSIHEDPDLKPQICSDFTPGSKTCLDVRKRVVTQMRMEDSIEADLVEISLGRASLRTLDPSLS